MKKVIFIILAGLLICSSVFSQSFSGGWKLQTPNSPNSSEVFYFGSNTYMVTGFDALANRSYIMQGYFSVSDGIMTIQPIGGKTIIVKVTWVNQSSFTLSTERMSSTYSKIPGYSLPATPSNGGGTYQPSTPSSTTNQPCWCCNGTGRCNICGGKGTVGSNKCPDCFGSGSCKHCSGTGRFRGN